MHLPAGAMELVVNDDGVLHLPDEVCKELHLQAGDLLAVEDGPLSLLFRPYRDFLEDNWAALAPALRHRFLEEFLSLHPAALGAGGALIIPGEPPAFEPGMQFLLQLAEHDHAFFLYPLDDPPRAATQSAMSTLL